MNIKYLNKTIRLQYLYYKQYNRLPKILHQRINPHLPPPTTSSATSIQCSITICFKCI